jgi:hypothetical protein
MPEAPARVEGTHPGGGRIVIERDELGHYLWRIEDGGTRLNGFSADWHPTLDGAKANARYNSAADRRRWAWRVLEGG